MADALDLENDEFLMLLTDALRNGPGSPEWHQAISQLGSQGTRAQQYRLLIAARQHLESGKSYRTIRAGSGFTQKVLEGIDREGPSSPRLLSANVIAFVSILIAAVIVAVVATWLGRGVEGGPAIEELANTYFSTPKIAASYPAALGPEWIEIGPLKLEPAKKATVQGWVLAPSPASKDAGGGIATRVDANQPFCLEVALRVSGIAPNTSAQVFVTDDPQFSAERGTSGHELVWYLQNGTATVVLPDGRLKGHSMRVAASPDPVIVRVSLKEKIAMIESGSKASSKRLWGGEHQLAADKPRYVGVRLIRRDGKQPDHVAVQSVKVLTP